MAKRELTLDEACDYLIRAPKRAELIAAVDELILSYRKNPKVFVMPNYYNHLVVLVETFAEDEVGWREWIKELTAVFPKKSDERMELQAMVKRKIESRVDAYVRRQRQEAAALARERRYGPFLEPGERTAYKTKNHALWALQRKLALARYRRDTGQSRVPQDERDELFDDFWQQVDDLIRTDQVPPDLDTLDTMIEATERQLKQVQ